MPDNSLSRSQEAETQASQPSPTSRAGLPVSEATSLPGSAQQELVAFHWAQQCLDLVWASREVCVCSAGEEHPQESKTRKEVSSQRSCELRVHPWSADLVFLSGGW